MISSNQLFLRLNYSLCRNTMSAKPLKERIDSSFSLQQGKEVTGKVPTTCIIVSSEGQKGSIVPF